MLLAVDSDVDALNLLAERFARGCKDVEFRSLYIHIYQVNDVKRPQQRLQANRCDFCGSANGLPVACRWVADVKADCSVSICRGSTDEAAVL